jgi:hypothetical protein
MDTPMCAICCAETNGLVLLEEPASCLFPHGARMVVEAGNYVCPEHRPISYLAERPGRRPPARSQPGPRLGGKEVA